MDDPTPTSTTQIPPQFLYTALFVGKLPFRTVQLHPAVSYTLYIPPGRYNPDPSRSRRDEPVPDSDSDSDSASALAPASDNNGNDNGEKGEDIKKTERGDNDDDPYNLPLLPLIVTVHGTRRGAESCRDRLVPLANAAPAAILAPLFPAAVEGPDDVHSYKVLRSSSSKTVVLPSGEGRQPPRLEADLALLDILDEVRVRWPGIDTGRIFLAGYSGGGQFAQRFCCVWPERVWAVSVGAPGSVVSLDGRKDWPDGVADLGQVFGRRDRFHDPHGGGGGGGRRIMPDVIKEEIRKVKGIQLVVGSEDDRPYGSVEFRKWLRGWKRQKQISRLGQGQAGKVEEGEENEEKEEEEEEEENQGGRLQNLIRLHKAWSEDGFNCRLDVVPGAGHNSDQCFAPVLEFLTQQVSEWYKSMRHEHF